MMRSTQQIAEHATFQNFANCYWREIDAGRAARHGTEADAGIECIEWLLPSQRTALRVEIVSRSLCGPCGFGRIWRRALPDASWQQTEPFTALCCLAGESYRRMEEKGGGKDLRGSELELLLRVLQSYQSVQRYLDAAVPADGDEDDFIAAEQSLVFGHWLHPTPKSLQGMTPWQQPVYAPELGGRFRLHWFAAPAARVGHRSAFHQSAPEMIAAILGDGPAGLAPKADELLIPMHPLQAEALALDPAVQAMMARGALRALGAAGPEFTATSSVRTVYSPDSPWMLKFSLPVRITNSVRVNRRHELDAGVIMARLIAAIGPAPGQRLGFVLDPAYITLDTGSGGESGFEVIIRENPFSAGRQRGVATVAALAAEPLPGRPSRLERVVRRAAAERGGSVTGAARAWFEAYLDCALDPVLRLYDTHGIALEAHQQNGLLDLRGGMPVRFLYRDNQGFYLSNTYRDALRRLIPEADNIRSLYYDEEEINRRFSYYVIVNQIFSVIARMGKDRLAAEEDLLRMLRARLERLALSLTRAGRRFAGEVLDSPTIGAKQNLTAGLLDIDELRTADEAGLYARWPNPLCRTGGVAGSEGGRRALSA
ncbi:IucA/IucC family protein [Azospirillum thermophilum]|uniref:IucA/IucC family protein n=1 Tax=Azospirillum thermophilum TaxID=2202148 RepID=A0A2S2CKF5_9PROT|nr:IucA/IucC family protein [Azospirillum thermophilum]AWK84971.1 IucA/IucC family protein [Azospirillum thermophilum]